MNRYKVCLTGSFQCELTCDESNKWHEYVSGLSEFKAYQAVKMMFEIAENRNRLEEADYKSVREQEEMMYEIGKAWYQDVVVPAIEAESKWESTTKKFIDSVMRDK